MKVLKLPDLGEGLNEAEIVEWHVAPGDGVELDQLLLSVETDKAVVEIPSPQDGVISRLFGEVGDIIHTGEPLVEFDGEPDTGTVVGNIESSDSTAPPSVDEFVIGAPKRDTPSRVRAAPAVRALARRLGIDLAGVAPSGSGHTIAPEDVERAHRLGGIGEGFEPLRRVRRTMAKTMARAHAEVVPVGLFDDADVHQWFGEADTTIRLVRAVAAACSAAPALNAWYDGVALARRLLEHVDLGIAVNTEDGLFVPVLRDITNRDAANLRIGLDRLRTDVQARTIPVDEMRNPTILLSNFGMYGGRYASPIVVPPTVAIVGAGSVRDQTVAEDGAVVIHKVMPISLTFDHRAVTGAEGATFLSAIRADLMLTK